MLLADGEVHVWCTPLDGHGPDVRFLEAQLSSEERARALRFKFSQDQVRYVISHGVLRHILSFYLRVDPRDLKLAAGANGKPELGPIPQKGLVQFNMSRSREVALFAVSRSGEIGIDVEYVDENFAFDEIVRQFFPPAESATLDSLPLPLRREAFFRCWTCKEALVKAKGTGLGSALDEIAIAQTGNTLALRNADPTWSLTELNPAPGYVGALAVETHDTRVKCWQWPPRETQAARRG
ncbi:MAG: 4'-phosphopantetheinyl transferase family protein [Candidatus Binatia bacterium]